MEAIVENSEYGVIVYNEGFWSGKKSLIINGVPLVKTGKKEYTYNVNDEAHLVTLKGNMMSGVSITIDDKEIKLVEKPVWYVLTLSLVMFIFDIVWGNSVALCKIFPVVGGAIGGLISAACAIGNIICAGRVKKTAHKLLIGFGFLAITILCCHFLLS